MKRLLIISIICVFVVSGIGLYFLFREKPNPNELVLYGNVDVRQVDIAFRVKGRIEKLFFLEGELVKKGQKMAVLDENPYINEVGEAKSKVEAIRFSLENTEILLKRQLEIIGVGGVSAQELDNTQAKYNETKAMLEGALEELTIAIENLSYTQVCAPNDGIILTRVLEEGSVVKEADPVYTLSLISPIWVRAYLMEPELGRVMYGDTAKIYTDVENGKVYEGKVGFISPVAEFTPKTVQTAQLRTDLVYRIRIYVDNPDGVLKQGMPVTVKLNLQEKGDGSSTN